MNSINEKEKPCDVTLKEKELELLKLACSEMNYKQIAALIFLSPKTIENYRKGKFEKLEVKTSIGLVLSAI